jgi:hypothetical protein
MGNWTRVRALSIAAMTAVAVGCVSPAASGATTGSSHGHSPSFAGYQNNGAVTSASTTFKLPALTCTATNSGTVPNLTLTNFTTEEFTGGGVYVQCVGGVATYGAYAEINNKYGYLTPTLHAGDTIKVSLATSAKGTTVTVADTTTKGTLKSTVKGPGGAGSFTGMSVGDAQIGSPGLPIPQFTPLRFTATKVNGVSLGAGTVFGSDMYNGATLQILAGTLSAAGTFTTTFQHS